MQWFRLIALLAAAALHAETGYDAWLRYEPIDNALRDGYGRLPSTLVTLDSTPAISAARDEMVRGLRGMLGRTLRTNDHVVPEDMLLLGTLESVKRVIPNLTPPASLSHDGYWLKATTANRRQVLVITALNDRGVLYGAFDLLRRMTLHEPLGKIDVQSNPYAPIRWVNQWDNLDGSIERGYAGRSIFFEGGNVLADLSRAGAYARLLASVGINGCTVNNVNANPRVLTPEFLPQLQRIAAAFRPWGVRLSVSVDFSSPKTIGGLDTFDPLDARVAAWWKAKADEIYAAIPDFGGFVLKADSEGRVGPSTYGRTHAEAANLLARALQPHGGILIYRGFVYNHHLDWRDLKNDRAKAAYDNFHRLDGQFDGNAAVQIKYGPIDFQAREPVSPLFGALEHTNEVIELQITQEYTGQQRHLCYLAPMWKQVLDFDLRVNGSSTPVRELVSGKTFHRPIGGFAGVANAGLDSNWLGHDLAVANLYGFGRLAWDPDVSALQIAEDWTRLTFGNDTRVVNTIAGLQMDSWRVYEGYTGPLGIGTLTDILRGHYGPDIESAERNGWGQWIRADHAGIGMDRTVAGGTGYIGQYPPAVAKTYESLALCPDELLLFMQHVPYSHILHSGKTVIQHIYDSHYQAAEEAQQFPERWQTLKGRIDEQRYAAVLNKLEYQAGHAVVWRDAICSWFLRMSGIADEKNRAGNFPQRIEAESFHLDGYVSENIVPWEDASGGKAIACAAARQACSAVYRFEGRAGWYDIDVQYFDAAGGTAHFELSVAGQRISSWLANAELPSRTANGDSSTRQRITGIALRPDDEIKISGMPDGVDRAAIDYIEIHPQRP